MRALLPLLLSVFVLVAEPVAAQDANPNDADCTAGAFTPRRYPLGLLDIVIRYALGDHANQHLESVTVRCVGGTAATLDFCAVANHTLPTGYADKSQLVAGRVQLFVEGTPKITAFSVGSAAEARCRTVIER